jgi:hypothetical protein
MYYRTLILASLFVSSPALAKVTYPVAVPQECVELARREGVPLMIENRYQAVKARYKLARLNGHDPLVRLCREAVARAKKAAEQYETAGARAAKSSAPATRSDVQ